MQVNGQSQICIAMTCATIVPFLVLVSTFRGPIFLHLVPSFRCSKKDVRRYICNPLAPLKNVCLFPPHPLFFTIIVNPNTMTKLGNNFFLCGVCMAMLGGVVFIIDYLGSSCHFNICMECLNSWLLWTCFGPNF